MNCKRTIAGVAMLWWIGAPGLVAQDYLKQLEETLLKRRSENEKVVPAAQKEVEKATPKQSDSSKPPIELAPPEPTNGNAKNGEMSQEEVLPEPKRTPVPRPNSSRPSTGNGTSATNRSATPARSTPNANRSATGANTTSPRSVNAAKPAQGGGYLGMTVEKVENSGIGVEVTQVTTDSPAWKAGFRNGDQLIAVAGTAISSVDDLAIELGKFAPGAPIRFLVDRAGRNMTLTAVLQDRTIANRVQGNVPGSAIDMTRSAPSSETTNTQAYFGAGLSTMSEAYRKQFGIGAFRGVSVTEVVENSPADLGGLHPGDCITVVNGVEVTTANALQDIITASKPGESLEIAYYRGAIQHTTVVKLSRRVPDMDATWEGGVITKEMLTPDYVAALQAELDRLSSELLDANAKVKSLEQRVRQLESLR